MAGDGPFLWLSETGPPSGFRHLPPGGMCLSAFLFVRRGGSILLGKYREHPAWETLAGPGPARVRAPGRGWTIPASQLKYGEDPRDAAKRIAEDILQMPGMRFSEPRVETDLYEPKRFPGRMHYDVWFLVDANPPHGTEPAVPQCREGPGLSRYGIRSNPRTSRTRSNENAVSMDSRSIRTFVVQSV